MSGMTWRFYRQLTEKEFKGRRARLTRDVRNGYATIAAGTVVTIDRKFSGFGITTDKCTCCNVRVHCSRVEPDALELLPP